MGLYLSMSERVNIQIVFKDYAMEGKWQFQVNPENINTLNIIKTEQLIFRKYIFKNQHVTIINEKEAMNLEKTKESLGEDLE